MKSQELKNAAYDEAARYTLPNGWEDGRVATTGNTVDSPHTRDKDDAIRLSHNRDTRNISVAIADTGTFLRGANAIEAYARHMGETRYLHAGNIPMIPPRISEGILSILDDKRQEGEIMPTPVITLRMSLGGRAMREASGPELVRESIRPTSYTYDNIAALTAGKGRPKEVSRWRGYEATAHELLALRRERGALAFYDEKKRVMTDEDGGLVEFRGRNMSGQLVVQEFMILANTAIAGYMARHNIPALYRNHHLRPDADPERLAKLASEGDITLDVIKSVYARARYSPHLEGHAGLNLQAYMHFTSPLRRFADFVNHANLAAHLDGIDYPYPGDDLHEIADHLNGVQDETRRTKRQSDLARIAAAASEAAAETITAKPGPSRIDRTTEIIVQSPNLSFGKSLIRAGESGELPVTIAEEAKRRLAKGRLTPGEMAILLSGRLASDETNVDLRTDMLRWLAAQPAEAHQIINRFDQTNMIGIITQRDSSRPEGGFKSEIIVTDDKGDEVLSQSADGINKNLASQRVALLLIATLNGQTEFIQDLLPENPAENHKGALQEALAKRRLKLPEYTTTRTADGVECTVTVYIGGEAHSFSGKGSDKKLAEYAAAEAARKGIILPPLPPAKKPPQSKKPTKAEKRQPTKQEMLLNPIVQLQNQAYKWHGTAVGPGHTEHVPKYEYEWLSANPKAPEFECTVHVTLQDGSINSFSGKGSSKANAKRAAAEVAMKSFTSDKDEGTDKMLGERRD